jgi:hypothetical protein
MGSIAFRDHDQEQREFFDDRQKVAEENEAFLRDYYRSRGWIEPAINDLLWDMDLSYPMSLTELVDYAARYERSL